MSLFLILIFPLGCREAQVSDTKDYFDCLSCHIGIEQISLRHDFDCVTCHLKTVDRSKGRLEDHKAVVRNPSALAHVQDFCLPCHEKEVEQIKNSLHATMAGVINQTRFLWGAQPQAAPAIYGLSSTLKPIPEPDTHVYPETPENLVDDFLRRKCLKCHIGRASDEGVGLFRAGGCAACHMIYEDDGRYHGNDEAIGGSAAGYPRTHEFTTRIPDGQCLHCHNHNHVGADYEGLFEHDHSRTYRSPLIDGKTQAMVYGLDYHHLSRDVHAEKGLLCVDCHDQDAVMGDTRIYSYQMEMPKGTCTGCHGGFDAPLPEHEGIKGRPGELVYVSKNKGQKHLLPLFSRGPVSHCVPAHSRVRCSACHAQWSFQDYGMSVIREDVMDPDKWTKLTTQGDPTLESQLNQYLHLPGEEYPVSIDWLSKDLRPGLWLSGWRFRRWEPMPLGVDHTGRIAVLRPLHQYLISYVDRLGNVPLDSVIPGRGDGSGRGWAFMPYVPHTTAPAGGSCERCHLNRVNAGLGIYEESTQDTALMIPSPPAVGSMRLLNAEEQKRLLEPSVKWKKERLRAVREEAHFGQKKDFAGISR